MFNCYNSWSWPPTAVHVAGALVDIRLRLILNAGCLAGPGPICVFVWPPGVHSFNTTIDNITACASVLLPGKRTALYARKLRLLLLLLQHHNDPGEDVPAGEAAPAYRGPTG